MLDPICRAKLRREASVALRTLALGAVLFFLIAPVLRAII